MQLSLLCNVRILVRIFDPITSFLTEYLSHKLGEINSSYKKLTSLTTESLLISNHYQTCIPKTESIKVKIPIKKVKKSLQQEEAYKTLCLTSKETNHAILISEVQADDRLGEIPLSPSPSHNSYESDISFEERNLDISLIKYSMHLRIAYY